MGSEIDLIALAAGWRLARRAGLKTGEQAAKTVKVSAMRKSFDMFS